ncbi:hypothetical protein [Streptomyces sp. SM12]|nr:hypothetical protein [Streptomyces sp. SM12]
MRENSTPAGWSRTGKIESTDHCAGTAIVQLDDGQRKQFEL